MQPSFRVPDVFVALLLVANLSALAARNDFDGDGRSDQAVYDPSDGMWYIMKSSGGVESRQFGFARVSPVTGDFDGDGRTDIACYASDTGMWYFMTTSEGYRETQFGFEATTPVTGDFDGDGRTDFGCFEPVERTWYLMASTDGFSTIQHGPPDAIPVTGDFDGDGRDDIGTCIYKHFNALMSSQGNEELPFDTESGFISPIVGDFDDDGRDDVGAYDAANMYFNTYVSSVGYVYVPGIGDEFNNTGTISPIAGDYDGDGRDDMGYYHDPSGTWVIYRSSAGVTTNQFGTRGMIPLGQQPYTTPDVPSEDPSTLGNNWFTQFPLGVTAPDDVILIDFFADGTFTVTASAPHPAGGYIDYSVVSGTFQLTDNRIVARSPGDAAIGPFILVGRYDPTIPTPAGGLIVGAVYFKGQWSITYLVQPIF